MRRVDRAIGRKGALEILREADYGILSISPSKGGVYGVPLSYSLSKDEAAIYFHSAREGRKLDIIAENNRASFAVVGKSEVIAEKFSMRYESAIVKGYVEEVFGPEKQLALEGLLQKYSPHYLAEGRRYIQKNYNLTAVLKLLIQEISGKARQ